MSKPSVHSLVSSDKKAEAWAVTISRFLASMSLATDSTASSLGVGVYICSAPQFVASVPPILRGIFYPMALLATTEALPSESTTYLRWCWCCCHYHRQSPLTIVQINRWGMNPCVSRPRWLIWLTPGSATSTVSSFPVSRQDDTPRTTVTK